jgi:uncharacterized protein involved in outer membrane biogenesis
MARLRRRILTTTATLLVMLTAILVVVILTLDLDSYRPELEQGLSRALGVDFKIGGKLRFSLQPELALTLGDVGIQQGETEVASVKKVSISFALWPLLQRQLQIRKVELEHARLSLAAGTWPLSQPKPASGSSKSNGLKWSLTEDSVYALSHSSLVYADTLSPWHTVIDDLSLHLKTAELDPAAWNKRGLSMLTLHGSLRADRITTKLAQFNRVRMQVNFDDGKLRLSDISSKLYQGDGHGDFTLDLSKPSPVYHLNFKLQELEASESISRLAKQGLIDGPLSLYADLRWQGNSGDTMLGSLSGDVDLRGEDLSLKNIDLDKSIATFEKSQHFNLVDLGAYFFIGPMGTVATKGYSFAKIATSSNEGPSRINQLISDWQLVNGIATAQDVALATARNRIALRGRLDLVNGRYDGVEFGVLDKQGCAILTQRITGPLQSPVIEAPKKLAILTAPVREALDMPRKLLGNSKCTPFYTGSLPHPGTQ